MPEECSHPEGHEFYFERGYPATYMEPGMEDMYICHYCDLDISPDEMPGHYDGPDPNDQRGARMEREFERP